MQFSEDVPSMSHASFSTAPPLVDKSAAIAIVGIGCRLPGDISSPSQLWDFLADGRSAAGALPKSRFNCDSYHGDKDEPASTQARGGYFLQDDIRQFDNQFFGINNREAAAMDPQQRKLLEVVFETFESAGVTLDHVSGADIGCYVASFTPDYIALQTKDPESLTRYSALGLGATLLSNRISHIFNLKGPSCVIDTACSSSLYALHMACVALQNGECDSAVVAGVNLIQSPELHIAISQAGLLSPSSTCQTFDSSADGYARADGVNAIYIKRLDDAIRGRDVIRSIIRGTAVNSNGRTPGISLPSVDGQEAVIRKAYTRAGLDPAETAYVETHGTGTSIGDPIEVEALSRVFNSRPTLLGSVKPNLGHGEASSGLLSVVKASLTVERGQIPPTISVKELNQKIRAEEWGVEVVTRLTTFPSQGSCPRRVSISSFGYGGANAHGIVDEAGFQALQVSCRGGHLENGTAENYSSSAPYLLPFSANKVTCLNGRLDGLSKLNLSGISVRDLAYTLGVRRSHLSQRGYVITRQGSLPIDVGIDNFRQLISGTNRAENAVQFVFTGQGAQWKGMGSELMQFPAFAETICLLDDELHTLHHKPSWNMLGILSDSPLELSIDQADLAQPITTAVQIGLVELLRSWGIRPQATLGHSSGEIAAAYTAGLITAREAMIIAYYRGYAVSKLAPAGLMAAVGLREHLVRDKINELGLSATIAIACINSPESVTVSGDCESITSLITDLQAEGVFIRALKTDSKAYHSHQMAAVGGLYQQLLDDLSLFGKDPSPLGPVYGICMYSTVTCKVLQSETARTTAYWRTNLESRVQFCAGLVGLSKSFNRSTWIEVGAHSALKLPILQTLGQSTSYIATLKRKQDSAVSLLACVGELFTLGFNVDFSKLLASYNHGTPRFIYDLPTYPWHYEDIQWTESRISREGRFRQHSRHELLGGEVPGGNQGTFGWRNILRLDKVPWLRDHKLGGAVVFPAAGYLTMAVEAFMQRVVPLDGELADLHLPVVLRQVHLPKALQLTDEEPIELYTELRPHLISCVNFSDTWWEFQISSISDDMPCTRAKGQIRLEPSAAGNPGAGPEIGRPRCGVEGQFQQLWYETIARGGLDFGPAFQHMQEIYTPASKGTLYAEARTRTLAPVIGGSVQVHPRYILHPTLLDAMLQVSLVACTGGSLQSVVARVPNRLGNVSIRSPRAPRDGAVIRSTSKITGLSTHQTDAVLLDAQQRAVARFTNVDFTTITGINTADEIRYPISRVIWRPDITLINEDIDFTAALEYVISVSHFGCFGHWSHLLAAIDLIVHKSPDAHILCLSTDLVLITVLLIEVLDVSNLHIRFNSFSLGRVASNGGLEVAEIRDYSVPLTLKTLKYDKPVTGIAFSLVVGSDGMIMDKVPASYTSADTTFFLAPRLDDGNTLLRDRFSVLRSHSKTGNGVQLFVRGPQAHVPRSDPTPSLGSFSSTVLIGRSAACPTNETLAHHLRTDLRTTVKYIALPDLPTFRIPPRALVISTLELQDSLLSNPSPEHFDAAKMIIEQASHIVWITGSGPGSSKSLGFNPTLSLFTGLARAVRVEQPGTMIFTLELERGSETDVVSRAVCKVLKQGSHEVNAVDCEYMMKKGNLMISRIVPDQRMNREFRVRHTGAAPEAALSTPLGSAGNAFLSTPNPGQSSTAAGGVRFIRRPLPDNTSLGDRDVLVKVSCIALNAKDVYALAGRTQTTNGTCSSEYTGHVVAIGSGSPGHQLAVGDKVAVMYPGRFATYEVVPSWSCIRLRDNEELPVMAGVLVVFVTVVYALHHRARLQRGESILIHSAAGGVGIAAIQLAKLAGAEIFATVGTEEKKQCLVDTFGLDAGHIFSSHDASFAAGVRAATNGRGVDVVLNSLVGDLLHESWGSCLADCGRFVEIGKRDILDHGRLDMGCFAKGTTFTAFDLSMFSESSSPAMHQQIHEMMAHVLELLRNGEFRPIQPLAVFKVAEIDSALSYFKNRNRIGKIVVSFEDENQIVPVAPVKYMTRLSPQKSYLLVGCLGGLGRSVSRWMVGRGARHFIFLGRTGLAKPAARRLIEELEREGAHCTVITGDVIKYTDVARAVLAAGTIVPLGGVVQAAMGLHESIFKYITQEAWQTGTLAKVEGTWNLHRALSAGNKEKHLDFFLLTSSIAGKVGTATEANYCAANNFLDAFAQYRRELGLRAISLGLGMISEVGYLHEHRDIGNLLLRKGIRPLLEDEMLQIVDFALAQQFTPTSVHDRDTLAQSLILTGLEDTGHSNSKSAEYTAFSQYVSDARLSVLRCALRRRETRSTTATRTPASVIQAALAEQDDEKLRSAVVGVIAEKFCNLILLPVDKLDVDVSMMQYGIDSMLAAELRQYIFSTTAVEVDFLMLMEQKTSVAAVARRVVDRLRESTVTEA